MGGGITGNIHTMTTWDPDGSGPGHDHCVVVGSSLSTVGSLGCGHAASWNGSAWSVFGNGPGVVASAAAWDADGDQVHEAVVAAGDFISVGDTTASRIAVNDGTRWSPMGAGFPSAPFVVGTWDPDGAGGLPSEVVAGGAFTSSGAVPLSRIGAWNGTAWHALGSGLSASPRALTTWDADGPGGAGGLLVVGGSFATAGGVQVNGVGAWNGSAWQALGSGVGSSTTVRCLTTWDPDGGGPLQRVLVAGGDFTTAGGGAAQRIAAWDGQSWSPFSAGIGSTVYCVTTWDPDGNGPLAEQVFAGGTFSQAGGHSAARIAGWDGVDWRALGSGLSGTPNQSSTAANAVRSFDPDGNGPMPGYLVVTGDFTSAGGVPAVGIARWNGAAWSAFGTGLGSVGDASGPSGRHLEERRIGVGGGFGQELVVSGRFIRADGVPAAGIALWSGAACGGSCDSIDFNGDGLLPDVLDVADFLAVLAGGVCEGQTAGDPPCNTDIDFNNDGLFPDTQDITGLLSVFGGGACV
ncbi:MAG TPA: hypothetical protein VHN77_15565 [Phycisphaerales bacterium]|nr:hypothetical protein [Phycisphaerales bacterium]